MALEKESLINFLPNGFETLNQEGYKENFSADKIATGYEKDVKDRVTGPNLNNLIDVIGKNTNTLNNYVEYLNNMPIGSVPIVNDNNNLDYASGFVQKSGDTMTGDLFVEKETPIIALKNPNIESSVPPTADSGVSHFSILDKNGNAMGHVGLERYANGRQTIKLQAFSPDGTFAPAIRVHANADNTANFTLSANPANTSNGTEIATTAFVKSVLSSSGNGLATISKASTGSIKFNNGFIVNWGRIQINAGSSAIVTFKTPFTSTNYKVVVTIYATDAGSQKNVSVNNYTTTNCKIYNGQGGQCNYDWIAIGY